MTRLIAGMTMSLDGFVEDASGSAAPLYPDFAGLRASAPMQEAMKTTGAVLMGRRTFEMATDPDSFADSYEFRTPLVILTRHPPAKKPKEGDGVSFIFATQGLEDAIAQARRAAGARNVMCVGGAQLIRALVATNTCDELHIDITPILLGSGLRLFDRIGAHNLRLDRQTHLPGGRICLAYSLI